MKKKYTFYVLIGVLFILSIINIVIEEREQTKLMTQVEETFNKTKTIVNDVGESLTGIGEAKDEIIVVDSIINIVRSDMANQVKLLDSAVLKSKEMLKLNQLEFQMGKPTARIVSSEVVIDIDSIDNYRGKLEVKYKVKNNGKRTASDLAFKAILIIENQFENYSIITEKEHGYELQGDLVGNLSMEMNSSIGMELSDYNSFNRTTKRIIIITKLRYIDEITREPYH